MSEYYIPEIEEFHVGFEFEMNDTWGRWKKLTLTEEMLKNPLVSVGSGNERVPYYRNTRVKYLDREDIESLGWNYKHVYSPQLEFMSENRDYEISYDVEINHLRVEVDEEDDVTLFNGTIKNKSELVTLLKQLDI